jgi:GR25 family glycosyltransferase involved in LPS biosynthesis
MSEPESIDPFDSFSAIYCINLDRATDRWETAQRRFSQLGLAQRVIRMSAVDTPHNHHVGCAQSWRRIIAEAERRHEESVLILEDDVIFRRDTRDVLGVALQELEGIEWDLLYLGGALHGTPTTAVSGRASLRQCGYIACTHALALHRRCHRRLLEGIPEGGPALEEWIAQWRAIDQYFGLAIQGGLFTAFITEPRLATQRELMAYAGGDLAAAEHFAV